ncbi:MAG: hypothetical protein KAS66_09345, partial [Candidatus Omnitrophica bacterium]|nr:hypothetical protein [Candidatus Omnitrophota bacterium]
MGSVTNFPYLLALLTVALLFISFALYLPKAQSSGLFFNQTDWSGGAQENLNATESDWIQYESADPEIDTSKAGEITLALIEGTFEDSTSAEFNQGAVDTTLAVTKGTITLSHPLSLNEYTVGALSDIAVNASNVEGYDPYTIHFDNSPDLSRVFKSDKFTDSYAIAFKVLSVSDA